MMRAHVPDNKPVLQSDVNVREFWGRSLDSMDQLL
jgi:hypothetical protein